MNLSVLNDLITELRNLICGLLNLLRLLVYGHRYDYAAYLADVAWRGPVYDRPRACSTGVISEAVELRKESAKEGGRR